ncbi:hypothetical protein SLA2020_447340 [Shorea laevis]
MYVKIEIARFDYFRTKQEEIRYEVYQGIIDSIALLLVKLEVSKLGVELFCQSLSLVVQEICGRDIWKLWH